jgi:1,2-diacylglycerol 3-beta-glucosyltransferase
MERSVWRDLGVGVITGASAVTAIATGYLARLALAARPRRLRGEAAPWRIDVIIPAHNEAAGIGATLESLAAVDYPTDRLRIVVVADNCTDDTADRARAMGVQVLERQDTTRRGKGYALAHAFAWSAGDGWAEAVVVIDADSDVNAGFFTAISRQLADGAESVQADYRIRNAGEGWRTRLMEVAFALQHTTRSLGRERLHWSCGLRGNGMAFRSDVLQRVPYAAFSQTEDIEYGIELGMAGVRVRYAGDAIVRGDMPTNAAAARLQRERWELGRAALKRKWRGPLFRALLDGQPLAGDLLLDLLVPPLATVALVAGMLLLAAGALVWTGAPWWVLIAPVVAMIGLLLYVSRGVLLTGHPGAALAALLFAPVYVVWKLLGLGRRAAARDGEWVRTPRPADL